MVDEALDRLIPHDPVNRQYALTGALSRIFRIKKGRLRICWLVSSAQREIVILFISDTLRKEGDARDPYQLFTRLVMSGEFDEIFDRLGVKRPDSSRVQTGVH